MPHDNSPYLSLVRVCVALGRCCAGHHSEEATGWRWRWRSFADYSHTRVWHVCTHCMNIMLITYSSHDRAFGTDKFGV